KLGPASVDIACQTMPDLSVRTGSTSRARPGALKKQRALTLVAGERCGALELRAGLIKAAELEEQVATHARQQVVARQRRLRGQRVHQLQARLGTLGHRHRHRA